MTPTERVAVPTTGPEAAPGPEARAEALDRLIDLALEEDIGDGDRTTEWTVPDAATGVARVVAKGEGVLAGRVPASRVFERLDPALELAWRVTDGDRVRPGLEILEVRGRLRAILTGERTALNFLARLSGVATLTRAFVIAIEGTGCRIVDTRKTTPGWRALEKAATSAGGAENHRLGLYDMVLIKENHARASGGIGPALSAVREQARDEGLEVEVEVGDADELEEALGAGAGRILLDNLPVEALRSAVSRVRESPPPRPLLEASGGVTLATVRAIAETGVDLISVGAITHSAPALDLSLLVDPGPSRFEHGDPSGAKRGGSHGRGGGPA